MDYNKRMKGPNDQEQSFLHPVIFLKLQEQSYPQPGLQYQRLKPGIEVTSEELPDLYKNMTLHELKEARLWSAVCIFIMIVTF